MIGAQILIVVIASAATCHGGVCDWRGFRGLEKDGRSDSTAPLTWSDTENVAWKTAIPGRGHSSPIVAGDAVYVTTGYPRGGSSGVQTILAHLILVLAILSGVIGIRSVISTIGASRRMERPVLVHAKFFLFHLFLIGTLIVALCGRRLLNPDNGEFRNWGMSVLMLLSCLVLVSLGVSTGSRRGRVAGALSLALAIGAFLSLSDKRLLLAPTSKQGIIAIGVCVLPIFFSLVTFLVHRRVRGPLSSAEETPDSSAGDRLVAWPYMITAVAGLATAIVPFFLILYRAADYQMPDTYIWSDRVRADVRWWWIVAGAVLFLVGALRSYRTRTGRPRIGRTLSHSVFFAVILSLGILFTVGIWLPQTGGEFIRAVVCLDRQTGQILWTCEGLRGRAHARGRAVTDASATPVTDGNRVYAYFGADGLMCCDVSGKLLWSKSESLFASQYGVGTSPVLKDNILVVVSDVRASTQMPSFVAAYEAPSGERLWTQQRPSHESYASYSTPLIHSSDGAPMIIVHGWSDVRAYDLESGRELWSYPIEHEAKHLVASPFCDGERLFITGGDCITALDLSKLGTGEDPMLWSTPMREEKSATPVVVGGLVFVVTENGRIACLDARTGRINWSKRLKGRFYASATAVGDRILLTNVAGRTTVVAADRGFRQLAENDLQGSVYASVAPAGRQMFIRTTEYLCCIESMVSQQ